MNDSFFKELEDEIKGYYDRKEYAACLERMEMRERETTDLDARAIVLTAKSNCAAHLGNLRLAENSAFAIDIETVSPEIRNYVYLTQGCIAGLTGQTERAESLFAAIIASKEAHAEPEPRALYEALGRLGSLYAHKNRFPTALDLLQKASILMPNGDLRDNFDLHTAYCLQALGRLDEAKECLNNVLENGSGELRADAYYRLGAVQLQAGEYEAAIDSFHRALDNLSHGKIAKSDILTALGEAEDERNMDPADRQLSEKRPKPPAQ
jgi:tetratricopeptide (TPR) repeat protein